MSETRRLIDRLRCDISAHCRQTPCSECSDMKVCDAEFEEIREIIEKHQHSAKELLQNIRIRQSQIPSYSDLEQETPPEDEEMVGYTKEFKDGFINSQNNLTQPHLDEDAIHDMCIDYWNEVDPDKMSTSYMIGLLSAKIRKLLEETR